MTGRFIGFFILLVIVIGGIWYSFSKPPATTPSQQQTNTQQTATSTSMTGTGSSTPATATVTYTNQGFSPQSITVAKGTRVTFVNQSSNRLWVATDPHPSHTGYDGTSRSQHCASGYAGAAPFDECASISSGGSWSFTFNKVGTWGYHNHAVDQDQGTIIVSGS